MNANLLKLKLDCVTQANQLEKTKKLFREEFDKARGKCKNGLQLFKDDTSIIVCLSTEHVDHISKGNFGDCVPMKCPLI